MWDSLKPGRRNEISINVRFYISYPPGLTDGDTEGMVEGLSEGALDVVA